MLYTKHRTVNAMKGERNRGRTARTVYEQIKMFALQESDGDHHQPYEEPGQRSASLSVHFSGRTRTPYGVYKRENNNTKKKSIIIIII